MPTIEYYCNRCGHTFQQLHFSGDAVAAPLCPQCRSDQVRKMPGQQKLFGNLPDSSTLSKDRN
jgi:putative FmdB family regulatory protein